MSSFIPLSLFLFYITPLFLSLLPSSSFIHHTLLLSLSLYLSFPYLFIIIITIQILLFYLHLSTYPPTYSLATHLTLLLTHSLSPPPHNYIHTIIHHFSQPIHFNHYTTTPLHILLSTIFIPPPILLLLLHSVSINSLSHSLSFSLSYPHLISSLIPNIHSPRVYFIENTPCFPPLFVSLCVLATNAPPLLSLSLPLPPIRSTH